MTPTIDATTDEVLVQVVGHVLTIGINREAQRNAVNGAVSAGIAAALERLDHESDLRAAVLYGVGTTFSAGMDLKAFAAGESVRHPHRGFAGIAQQPPEKPIIAAVEGWALGGGFEIALVCDLIVASREAKFGLPEVKRGLAARGGGVFRLPRRIPRSIAMELILTGAPLGADRATDLGLVNRLVAPGETLAAAIELAAEISANAPMSVRASKRIALKSAEWPEAECFDRQRDLLDVVFASEDAAEGVAAFRERRDPVWKDR